MEKFYLGMDIGTDSVGMACTDENYRLLRANGKNLWSVRLFDEANDATDRRVKRSQRRRLQRRSQRIDFLQDIFANETDVGLFFIRMNNSGFIAEDKDKSLKNSKYSLFADEGFRDNEFYDRFPTIFHLRQALMQSEQKEDWRLYYLALHHLIKYRGHFLFEDRDLSAIRNFDDLLKNFNKVYKETYAEEREFFFVAKAEEIKGILVHSDLNIKDKTKALMKIIDSDGNRDKAVKLNWRLSLTGIMKSRYL